MKKIFFLLLVSFGLPAWAAITVSNVTVSDIRDSSASYGNVWKGTVTYDVAADTTKIWTWLEFSSDGGTNWNQREVQTVGNVGTITPGTGKVIQWLIDGDKGPECMFRVRANSSPAFFRYTFYYKDTATGYAYLDTVMDSVYEFPKPQPEDDPYAILERLGSDAVGWDFTSAGNRLPDRNASNGFIDFKAMSAYGDVEAGAGYAGREVFPSYADPRRKYRATYFHCGAKEYVMINRNSIRLNSNDWDIMMKAIEDSLGIPREQVTVTWDHTHYTDFGEPGPDSTIAAIRRARMNARPVSMALAKIRVGVGYNFRRIDASHSGTTDGPIDDNIYAFILKNRDNDSLVAGWFRFTGHDGSFGGGIQDSLEKRLGGIWSYMYAGGGTTSTWTDYEAVYFNQSGRWNIPFAVGKVCAAMPALSYAPLTRIGVASARDDFPIFGAAFVQAFRMNNLFFCVYPAESPEEQLLYTHGRLESFTDVVTYGYGNGGGGDYYPWGPLLWNNSGVYAFFREAQATVRAVNILRNLSTVTQRYDTLSILALEAFARDTVVEEYLQTQVSAVAQFPGGSWDTVTFSCAFKSLDPSLASVTVAGLVSCNAPGGARILVTSRSLADTVSIRIAHSTLTADSVRVSPCFTGVAIPDSVDFHAIAYYHKDAYAFYLHADTSVTWSAGAPSATVSGGRTRGVSSTSGVAIRADLDAVSDVCSLAVFDVLKRVNFGSNIPAWLPDGGEAYSVGRGYGWVGATGLWTRDARNGNLLVRSFTGPQNAAGPQQWRIDVPAGEYVTKIAMGDNQYGVTDTCWAAFGADTIGRKPAGFGNGVKVDTITVTGSDGLTLTVYGVLDYIVLISNNGADINRVANDFDTPVNIP